MLSLLIYNSFYLFFIKYTSQVGDGSGYIIMSVFILTGGTSQFDVSVVLCYSSLGPVLGHVISQVHRPMQQFLKGGFV